MKRGLKIVGWIVGLVVLLLLVATVAIKLYLTKDRVMGWVVPPLEEKLHRTVTIGDVGAGLTGLYLDGIEVRAEGAAEPLMRTERRVVCEREFESGLSRWALESGGHSRTARSSLRVRQNRSMTAMEPYWPIAPNRCRILSTSRVSRNTSAVNCDPWSLTK